MPSTIAQQLHDRETNSFDIIDCDLHVYPKQVDEIVTYLRDEFQGNGILYPTAGWKAPTGEGKKTVGKDDTVLGSDPERTLEKHVDPLGIDHAIITGGGPNLQAAVHPKRRYAAALTSAYNDWLAETWLSVDDRFWGSISVSPAAPEAAAEEIRRLGDHPDMVQVIMGSGSQIPLGQEKYWPIYEAAESEGLSVAIHAGSEGNGVGNPNSGAGYPSTYTEYRTVQPANFMGQLLSIVLEGVFVKFPNLQLVMIGSGFSWVAPFLWRIDKCWKGLTDDVPWITRPPSEYVREHVQFTSYPINEPKDSDQLARVLDMMHAEDTLMFSTNYPHWDSYTPEDTIPDIEPALQRAIFSETATSIYGI